MSIEPEDQDESFGDDDDPGAASLTDLRVAQQRSGLSAAPGQKAGDITDQLARIRLPGEADLSSQPVPPAAPQPAAPSQPPLRAVRNLDSPSTIPPAPPEQPRPTEQLLAASEQASASFVANDMAHDEIQQELLSMMDRIGAGLTGGPGDDAAQPQAMPPVAMDPIPAPPEPVAPPLATPPPTVAPAEAPPPAAPTAAPVAPAAPMAAPVAAPVPQPVPPAPSVAAVPPVTAAPPPAASPPPPAAPEPPKAEPLSRMPQGLLKYWMSLTKGRKYPSWANFEPAIVADYWPNSMVLTCGPADGRGNVTISKVTRIADQSVTPSASGTNRVEYTPMLTEWILSLGKATAASGKPMQESDRFPTNEGLVRYQIILLPLSDEQASIDHVLCHVYRA